MGAVIVIVLLLVFTLPLYTRYEKRHMNKWKHVKQNWDKETAENKVWLVGEYIKSIAFGVLLLIVVVMCIKELIVRWWFS